RQGGDDPEAQAAMDTLLGTIRTNDGGHFWPAAAPTDGARPGASVWERAASYGVGVQSSWAALDDGIVLFTLAMIFLLFHLRRVLKDEPSWVPLGLAGLVLLAAALRLLLSREAPMNAWPYERIIPIARRTFDGVVLPMLSRTTGTSFDLT